MIDDEVFARRAARLRWLLFDVDGVLTDGTLLYTRWGEQVKRFHVKDGLAFALARRAGLEIGLLSGRRSRALELRAGELGVNDMMLGVGDKSPIFDRFLERHHVSPAQVAYAGDDLPDLPVLGRCALAFCPRDAAREVRSMVHCVLETRGGRGAAREMIERVLKARGEWQPLVAGFSLES